MCVTSQNNQGPSIQTEQIDVDQFELLIPDEPPDVNPELILEMQNALIDIANIMQNVHTHDGYDQPHDRTPQCCNCCVFNNKTKALDMLEKLRDVYPGEITHDIYLDIKNDIFDFYEENPDGNWIPDSLKNFMMRLIIDNVFGQA